MQQQTQTILKSHDIASSNMKVVNYKHQQRGRRPVVLGGGLLSAGFVLLALNTSAEWYVYLPASVCLCLCIWEVIADKRSGCTFHDEALSFHSSKWERTFPLDKIEAMLVTDWSDSGPTLVLQTRQSAPFTIPSYCIGSSQEFIAACLAKGIKIVRTN